MNVPLSRSTHSSRCHPVFILPTLFIFFSLHLFPPCLSFCFVSREVGGVGRRGDSVFLTDREEQNTSRSKKKKKKKKDQSGGSSFLLLVHSVRHIFSICHTGWVTRCVFRQMFPQVRARCEEGRCCRARKIYICLSVCICKHGSNSATRLSRYWCESQGGARFDLESILHSNDSQFK